MRKIYSKGRAVGPSEISVEECRAFVARPLPGVELVGDRTFDGSCSCCGDKSVSSAGCSRCTSRQTLCGRCGIVLVCGCGLTVANHDCDHQITVAECRAAVTSA